MFGGCDPILPVGSQALLEQGKHTRCEMEPQNGTRGSNKPAAKLFFRCLARGGAFRGTGSEKQKQCGDRAIYAKFP